MYATLCMAAAGLPLRFYSPANVHPSCVCSVENGALQLADNAAGEYDEVENAAAAKLLSQIRVRHNSQDVSRRAADLLARHPHLKEAAVEGGVWEAVMKPFTGLPLTSLPARIKVGSALSAHLLICRQRLFLLLNIHHGGRMLLGWKVAAMLPRHSLLETSSLLALRVPLAQVAREM